MSAWEGHSDSGGSAIGSGRMEGRMEGRPNVGGEEAEMGWFGAKFRSEVKERERARLGRGRGAGGGEAWVMTGGHGSAAGMRKRGGLGGGELVRCSVVVVLMSHCPNGDGSSVSRYSIAGDGGDTLPKLPARALPTPDPPSTPSEADESCGEPGALMSKAPGKFASSPPSLISDSPRRLLISTSPKSGDPRTASRARGEGKCTEGGVGPKGGD